ncbi:hypothetical protein Btru_040517 [Bulinus truncatus]|nr:hypothetical protein Btru_040517 [Bulinus truncatus]
MQSPVPEDVCYVCGVYTGYHVRICRVCLKAYHDGCLLKIGHPLTDKSRRLIGCKQWSCHQCVALNHLLTQEEVRGALEDLEDLDISREHITEADYLNFCKQSLTRDGKMFTSEKEASSLTRFRVAAKSGVITWTDFLNMESIRILNKRNKDSLVHLLTQSEIAEARKAFKLLDKKEMGLISKSEVQNFFDSAKTRVSSYFPDDSMIYIDEDLDSPVTWGEFLRDRAIYFLGQRPNLMKVINSNSSDDNLDKENVTRSYDSMDDDDEDYTLCLSEVDHGDHHHSCEMSRQDQVLVNSAKENQVRASAKTMLDDINVELEKSHKLQEMQAESAAKSMTADTIIPSEGNELGNQNEGKLKSQNIRSSRLTPERFEPTLYNDSLHAPIPWDNLGDRSPKKNQDEKHLHRRSEVITRKQVKPNQARAVSQVGCKAGKNVMAPAYGNLVDIQDNTRL